MVQDVQNALIALTTRGAVKLVTASALVLLHSMHLLFSFQGQRKILLKVMRCRNSTPTAGSCQIFPTLMNIRRFAPLCLALALSLPVFGADQKDDAGNTKVRSELASKILELAYSPTSLRDSFSQFLNPALDAMKQQGMPESARTETRRAFTSWFDEDIKWEEIKPKLAELYTKAFTEEELRGLLAIYQQPLGQKIMAKLPIVLQEGSIIGQQYYNSKQDALNARLAPIVQKYKK